ncbi:FRG domain-containing protein [Vibrio astriarenae]|uniref:FRG domain-containing protein n=1 Tax=Vibrio astriarenae TaxID=1481923 RepID=A0A7Z2T0Z0_9VIBR|nr:FRG domain-containing protein [Vibrio astriarenae]QIA62276.1 FRG domain-containing protein [Vibrio astriarenae]
MHYDRHIDLLLIDIFPRVEQDQYSFTTSEFLVLSREMGIKWDLETTNGRLYSSEYVSVTSTYEPTSDLNEWVYHKNKHYKVNLVEHPSWDSFKDYVSREFYNDIERVVFRGQRDSAWDVTSSLTRIYSDLEGYYTPEELEHAHLNNFKFTSRGRLPFNNITDEALWALGQHYGLATPYVDWTTALYYAVFFAFASPERSSTGFRAIYSLSIDTVVELASKDSRLAFEVYDPALEFNQRLLSQCGLLTRIPTGKTLEQQFDSFKELNLLVKHMIPDCERALILNDLSHMGIDYSSMFPDLHGSSLQCNFVQEHKIALDLRRQELSEEFSSKVRESLNSDRKYSFEEMDQIYMSYKRIPM